MATVEAAPATDTAAVAAIQSATKGKMKPAKGTAKDSDCGQVDYEAEAVDLNGDGPLEVLTKEFGACFDQAGLQQQIEQKTDLASFFSRASAMHPNSALITGVVCGVRVEEVEDPLMKKLRELDKCVDELAKGTASKWFATKQRPEPSITGTSPGGRRLPL